MCAYVYQSFNGCTHLLVLKDMHFPFPSRPSLPFLFIVTFYLFTHFHAHVRDQEGNTVG